MEMHGIWNMKCMIIPVIIGAIGTVTGLRKNLEDMPGKHSIDTLEYTVLHGISHKMLKY
jgi:hypothetical protein